MQNYNNNRKLYFLLKKPKPKPKKIYNLLINRPNHNNKLDKIILKLPPIVDLRNKFPPVYNQGNLGSCTANALCGLVKYLKPKLQGSRLFLYYNERKLENNIPDDSGATLESGIICLQKYGICQETDWPYIINKFTIKPSDNCYTKALDNQALKISPINETLQNMKSFLAQGFPFVVGIQVYQSFESYQVAKTGVVPLPNTNNEVLLGGHAVLCVGYNDNTQQWIMRNSWGSLWGV